MGKKMAHSEPRQQFLTFDRRDNFWTLGWSGCDGVTGVVGSMDGDSSTTFGSRDEDSVVLEPVSSEEVAGVGATDASGDGGSNFDSTFGNTSHSSGGMARSIPFGRVASPCLNVMMIFHSIISNLL